MTTEEIPHYILLNAEFLHKKYPETFLIPGEEVRMNRQVGDFVKLIFREEGRRSERLWCYITAVQSPGNYTGVVDNDPLSLEYVKCGLSVNFQAIHIIQYQPRDKDWPEPPPGFSIEDNVAITHLGCNTPEPVPPKATS